MASLKLNLEIKWHRTFLPNIWSRKIKLEGNLDYGKFREQPKNAAALLAERERERQRERERERERLCVCPSQSFWLSPNAKVVYNFFHL